MARRKEVFQSKVLQRLFPAAPQYEPSTPPVEKTAPRMKGKATAESTTSRVVAGKTQGAEGPGRRMYTVLPPPADYQADLERSSTLLQSDKDTAEETRDDADMDSGQDGVEKQTSRRKKRRKKKAAICPDCKNNGAAPAIQPSVAPGQTRTQEGGKGVSKNKKRKLKKKRHKEKLLSLGLTPQAAAVEFTYRKDSEGSDESGRRVAEVSDFLRSTMKLYMSDSTLSVDERRLRSGTLEDLLSSIASGSKPAPVLKQLSTLQSFVQQRELDKLEAALKELRRSPSWSEGERTAVSALFHYWITDVVPAHGGEEAAFWETVMGQMREDEFLIHLGLVGRLYGTWAETQAYHNLPVTPPADKSVPGMAVLLGAVGIGMCGYSSRQLALHHRPSARVLQLVGTHTDASAVGTAAQRTPFLDAARWAGACQEIPPPSFVGPKVP